MSYERKLIEEIYKILDDLAADGTHFRAEFIAHGIVNKHKEGLKDGDDKDFWLHCTYEKVRATVTRCINKRAGDKPEAPERQHLLPGYDHVHAYYVVRRNGDDIGVPATDLTDDEIDQKSSRYREMGQTCFAHSDELQRFKRERRAGRAA